MSFDYAKSAATARRLLTSFGQAMILSQDTLGTYDTATGTYPVTTVNTTDNGVIFAYSHGVSSIAGSLIQQGDQQVYINISVVPKPTDRLTVNSTVYNIIAVKALEPSAVNVIYELQVRR